ncbi:MAG: proline dehydrogenase family protein [Ginsengibacter sp.]
MEISFENTQHAFAYKSDKELKEAKFLFSSMGLGWLVKVGTRITPLAIKAHLPIKGLLRNTIFKQFVGGETLEQTQPVAKKLGDYNVEVILDYGVEGKDGEENFDHATDAFINVINYAATQKNIPFISVKLTGFARFGLLEKLNENIPNEDALTGQINLSKLTFVEKEEWKKVVERMEKICDTALSNNIGVLIDAEESWIQQPVDALTMQMMKKYNTEAAVLYNTIQLYRHDRLSFLKETINVAKGSFIPGLKIVRGAYMEKERKRALSKGYKSPIQPNKLSTDRDYNEAVSFCIEHLKNLRLIIASHNEYSNLYATHLLAVNNDDHNHPHIHFSQLYGMSDNITFNLAKAGLSVSKYLPFGPINDVIPYLMRRAQENSSVSGQTGRELNLIQKELKRRRV